MTRRRSGPRLAGIAALGLLALQPALMRPAVGIALVFGILAVWLAWRSVAYPLALAGIPTIVEAILGYNPLPKGGVTFLFAAWIAVAIVFMVLRHAHRVAQGALISAPVLLSLLLLGVMLLRLGASPAEAYGSVKVQHYLADNLIFMFGAIFVGARRSDLRLFFVVTLAVAAGEALLLMGKLLSGGLQVKLADRFSLSAQEYPLALARTSADGLVIAIYGILAAGRTWSRLASVALLPLLAVALLAAGSRGPVVALAVGLVVLVGLVAASGRSRRRLLAVAGGLLGAAVIVPLIVPGSTVGRAFSTLLGSASGLSSNGRSGLWAQAYTVFGEHPLFGIGTGGFASVSSVELYPHNLLLEMAVELGIAGVLLIVGIVAGSSARLIGAWRAARGRDKLDAVVLLTLFLMAVLNALFSGAIQDNMEVWVWAGLGIGMSARLTEERLRARRMETSGFREGSPPGRGLGPPRVDPTAA
jgi:O-antigen ligase